MSSLITFPDPAADQGLLRLPRQVLFGAGQRHATGPVVAALGTRALICTDKRLAGSPELREILTSLRSAGVQTEVFSDTAPELPASAAVECAERLRGTTIDVVIGVGGGSCLDMAKVVAVLLAHGGHPSDYYGENNVPGSLPVVAVPTTAGTGSEATPVAVLTDPELALKVGISSPHLIPQVAIIDPELTHSCPPSLTAAAGIDAVVHLVESFTAVRRTPAPSLFTERVFIGKSALTDMVALSGLSLMGRALITAFEEPDNAAARRDVMLAAFYGGIALGTAGTAAAHALQYPLGELTHTPHGLGTGCLLPYVMRFNLPNRVTEFAQIADALGVPGGGRDPLTHAKAGIEAVDALVDGVGIPRSLKELGLEADRVPELAERGLKSQRLVDNNPRLLDLDAALAITTAAYDGDRSFPTVSSHS